MSATPAQVEVTRSCIGAGMCLAIAPELFDFSPQGRAHIAEPTVTEDANLELVQLAADACPAQAIQVVNRSHSSMNTRFPQ